MSLLDWCITLIPLVLILGLALYSRKYIRGVVDYLASGRVAGRYVISVGEMSSSLSVITIVAMVEMNYQTGFAMAFWNQLLAPLGLILALSGYCVYRFRETKSLSIGQFLEMRYSRSFRVFAASLRTLSEMLTNAIGPAIATNFFIYFLGLPRHFALFGCRIPTFAALTALILLLALAIIWPAGRISLLVTDCFQGLISYPIFVLIVVFVLVKFSWSGEIAPVMLDRVPGENFRNPFDISRLRDFNLFGIIVFLVAAILNRASWIGNDTTTSARNPHEQKMAGVLGSWRNGFSAMMCLMIAVMIITLMTHEHFAPQAHRIRQNLSGKVLEEVVSSPAQREKAAAAIRLIPVQRHRIGVDRPLSRNGNPDTQYMETARKALGETPEGRKTFQRYRTVFSQMMMPMVLRELLPAGLLGIFCLLMVMLLVSTDDTRIFNSSSTIIQDILLPFRKTALTPEQHVRWLKWSSLGVTVFFFAASLLFTQMDYIQMFLVIMSSIWLGGAGPVMIFGLYSRFGTTAGAYASIIAGSGCSTAGILLQQHWAAHVYPFLVRLGWTGFLDRFLRTVSGPFEPYILWRMDPVKFPINSYEIYFISMMSGLAAYVLVSLVTCRKPFDLDRMLHRGIYSIDGEKKIRSAWTLRNFFPKLIGITPEYTMGDKAIAWSVFLYSFVYKFLVMVIAVLIWNLISPWPAQWWSTYFLIGNMIVAGMVGVVSTVWFFIGGARDGIRLFRDLARRKDNPLDDGRVEGCMSLADKAELENAEIRNFPAADGNDSGTQ